MQNNSVIAYTGLKPHNSSVVKLLRFNYIVNDKSQCQEIEIGE